MIKPSLIKRLYQEKNLLAFSAGGDSTALFFLLLKQNISFDIAIVNYNTREQSKKEITYAQTLAQKYHKNIFIKTAPFIDKNFESKAREIRYKFFDTLMQKYNYQNLLTGHHLNDKFEWFLMQLSKGAGLPELINLKQLSQRKNYTLVRPLLNTTKDELLDFLKNNDIIYYEDKSNENLQFKRNQFRYQISNDFIKKYSNGIKKSFQYLDKDEDLLFEKPSIKQEKKLFYFKKTKNKREDIYIIDKILKQNNYLLSHAQRSLLETEKDIVIGNIFCINYFKNTIFIAPFVKKSMDKKSKEQYRKLKIPILLRPYLFLEKNTQLFIFQNLTTHKL